MLYQDMLTGYLYDVPDHLFYTRGLRGYHGLGNAAGFWGAVEPVLPRFVPVASQTMSGLGQADVAQQQMQLISQLASQIATSAATPGSASAMPSSPGTPMQVPQIPVPGMLPPAAQPPGLPTPVPLVPAPAPMPAVPASAGEPGILYCYSQPQPGVAIERVIPPPTAYHRRRFFRRRRR